MIKNLKIKPLSKQQIIISLDRLTRFKNTEEKYIRVFSDIISSNLIEPKLKKDEIKSMPAKQVVYFINRIFDETMKYLNLSNSGNFKINKILDDYENKTFKLSADTKVLLKNKIDYQSFLQLQNDNLPCNLKWLKHIDEKDVREKYSTRFPIEKVILVEGITEEILLPKFAKVYGFDFDKNGVLILPAGGKNQSVKVFYELSETLKLPIIVLFDKDAKENAEEIKPKLRGNDKIHILECGEFEDALSLNHIKRTLNRSFKNYYSFSITQLRDDKPMTKILENLFKECGSEFKKAEFAHYLSENVKSEDVTENIKEILDLCR
ncbi:ATP-dependent endonuclease [bacterium]|nr:ATP-dependent endonuclease [bacterium]